MAQFFANNVTVYANKLIKASDTEILVNDVAYLPNVTGGDFFLLTFFNEASGIESGWEVVKVTAINYGSNTITVVRSQEGTTSRDFAVGTKAQMRATAGTLDKFKYDIESKLDDAQATASGLALLGAADVAAQRSTLGLANHQLVAVSSTGRVDVDVAYGYGVVSRGPTLEYGIVQYFGATDYIALTQYGMSSGVTGVEASSAFALRANGGEAFRVSPGRKLLLNTTTDDGVNQLQVNGSGKFSGTLTVADANQTGIVYSKIVNTYGSGGATGSGTGLQFYGWNAGITANIKSLREGSSYSPSYLSFETYGGNGTTGDNTLAERMRIDGRGNLGLGVVPSAWRPNTKAIDINGKGAVWAGTAAFGADIALMGNAYFSIDGERYKESAAASLYSHVNGSHQWFTAPSGTAGNAVSFTQTMTLNASGRLLVGTTTDDGVNVAQFAGSITTTKGVTVPNCADDVAAATAGVPVGAIYRTGTTLKVRAA